MAAIRKLLSIILSVFILSACTYTSNEKYSSLTDKQKEEVIQKYSFDITATKDIEGIMTVMMFKKNNGIQGYYYGSSNKKGEITSQVFEFGKSETPVIIGGVATGLPFVTISINDERIIQAADHVIIDWEDGYSQEEKLNGQSHYIIPYNKEKVETEILYENITIFDNENNGLFNSEE
ncbi:hypothetical protein [Ferdinandcohnia sp. SAFN-114]|uniref:hypothetical protein n=1 Tax=Ferdinandcohnia sp. SAFN-114 TaxID=3387275 RepID=UPI003F816C95